MVNGASGKALAIFDQIENQDIFTASASGTTRFSITNAGAIGLSGATPYGSSGQCLMSGGGATSAVTWGACSSSGGAFTLNETDGAIYQGNTTADLILGGTATSSARFAFLNMANPTNPSTPPTFRIFDSTGADYISLYHDGTNAYLQTNTGDVVIGSGAGGVNIEDAISNENTTNNGFLVFADKILHQATETVGNALFTLDNLGAGDLFTASASGTTRLSLASAGHLYPGADDVQDLGSSALRWRDLYLGPASIHMGAAGDEGIITFNTTTNTFEFDSNGDATAEFTINSNNALSIGGDYGSAGQCLISNGSGAAATWGSCGTSTGGTGATTLNTTTGVTTLINNTTDFLVGGSATASAKFQVFGDTGSFQQYGMTPQYLGGADNGGTSFRDVFISGKYAYYTIGNNAGTCSTSVSTGCELQIWNVSDPASPTYVGGAEGGDQILGDVVVVGNYAYTSGDSTATACSISNPAGCGIRVYDVSDPNDPVFVGGAETSEAGAEGQWLYNMDIQGNYIYITQGSGDSGVCSSASRDGCEFKIYDISNPVNPRYVGGADSGTGAGIEGLWGITVQGNYAYVGMSSDDSGNNGTCSATNNTGCELQKYDISDPTNPRYVAGADTTNAGTGTGGIDVIMVQDHYVYAGKTTNTGTCNSTTRDGCDVMIFDDSDANAFTYVGGVDWGDAGGNNVGGIAFAGKYMYASVLTGIDGGTCNESTSAACEITAWDVSDKASPTYLGGVNDSDGTDDQGTHEIVISGRYLYPSGHVDASTCTAGSPNGCEVQIWDIGGADVTGLIAGGADIGQLTVRNDAIIDSQLFVNGGLMVGPGGISSQGTLSVNTSIPNSTRSGELAASFTGGSVEQKPGMLKYVNGFDSVQNNTGTDGIYGVISVGNFTYVSKLVNGGTCSTADKTGCEVQIYETSNPEEPNYIGGYNAASTVYGPVAVAGNYMYVPQGNTATPCTSTSAAGTCGVAVVDISNKTAPVKVGGIDSTEAGTSLSAFFNVTIAGNYLLAPHQTDASTCSSSTRDGCEIQIYDISNPINPVYKGGVDALSTHQGQYAEIKGNYLYAAFTGNSGTCSTGDATGCEFRVYDITNISNPVYQGGADVINAGNGSIGINEIEIVGNYAYIARSNGTGTCSSTTRDGCELQIYNISNPTTLSFVGGVDSQGVNTNGLSVTGGRYVYLGNYSSTSECSVSSSIGCEIQVWDTIDKSSPVFMGGANIGTGSSDSMDVIALSVSGSYIYTAGLNGVDAPCSSTERTGCEFQIYDISGVKTTSVTAGSIQTGELIVNNNAVIDDDLYVNGGLTVGKEGILSQGDVAVGRGSITQSPADPKFVGGADHGTTAALIDVKATYVVGDYAYVGKESDGGTCSSSDKTGCELQIYDVSDPTNPTYVGGANNGSVYDIAVAGKYAYLAGNGTFRVYDISNPKSPTLLDTIGSNTGVAVHVSGKYAYIGTTPNSGTCSSTVSTGCEFQIFDVSDPANVVYVGGADGTNAGTGTEQVDSIYVQGKYAYIAEVTLNAGTCSTSTRDGCEFLIYDISDPTAPAFTGGASTSDLLRYVEVSGSHAYIAKNNESGTCNSSTETGCEFLIYDITDPTAPAFTGGYDLGTSYTAWELDVAGKYVYLSQTANTSGACTSADLSGCEIKVFDVSDETSPALVGGANSGNGTTDPTPEAIFISGRYAYVGRDINDSTCSSASNLGCEFQIYDTSGIEANSITSGSLETGLLTVKNDATIANQLYVGGGLAVGSGGINSQGTLSVSADTIQLHDNQTTAPTRTVAGELGIGAAGTGATDGRIWIRAGATPTNFYFQSAGTGDFSEFFKVASESGLITGEVVSLSSEKDDGKHAERTSKPYDSNILGIVARPGEGTQNNNSQDGDRENDPNYANISLLGQTPLKVSTESGNISKGDYLTSSSTPGLAMKATKAGKVIGQALEDQNEKDTIWVYVNPGWHDPDVYLTDTGSLSIFDDYTVGSSKSGSLISRVGAFADIISGRANVGALTADELFASNITAEEVVTDSLTVNSDNVTINGKSLEQYILDLTSSQSASVSFGVNELDEVTAGKITADEINVGTLRADRIEGLDILVGNLNVAQISDLRSRLDELMLQASGSATIQTATTSAEESDEQRIARLLAEDATSSASTTNILTLGSIDVAGIATVSGNLKVRGSTLVEGILTVIDTFMAGDLLITGVSNFLGETIFGDRVTFEDQVKFAEDSAGVVILGQGTTTVNVTFGNEMDSVPQVTATLLAEGTAAQKQAVLSAGYDYAITDVTTTGFTIQLNKAALSSIKFNWVAIQTN